MTDRDNSRAARYLASQADRVTRASGREPLRAMWQWVTRGRVVAELRPWYWPVVPRLDGPWQDTISGERVGWRSRSAWLGDDDFAFAVCYRICRRCRLGWVEEPYTLPKYQRCGLARAGLERLRVEHPGLAWHTLGGHSRSSQAFWAAVSADVPGGYQQRKLCPHVKPG